MANKFLSGLLVCAHIFLYGCAGLGNALDTPRQHYRKAVVIVYTLDQPEMEFDFTGSKGEGSASGAANGFLDCWGHPSDPVLNLYSVLCSPFGLTIGAVRGAVDAESSYVVEDHEAHLRQSLAKNNKLLYVQQKLANLVHARLSGATASLPMQINGDAIDGAHTDSRYGALLKVTLQKLTFSTHNIKNDPICLHIQASATKYDAKTGKPLASMTTGTTGGCASYIDWVKDDGKAVVEAIERSLDGFSENIAEELYLVYHPSVKNQDSYENGERVVPPFVLAPYAPKLKEPASPISFFLAKDKVSRNGFLRYTEVDNLTPTFRWESFPRDFDAFTAPGDQPKDVTYEFRLYAGRKLLRSIGGLKENSYSYPQELASCTIYYWTVRAKFNLNGYPRVTEWAGVYDVPGYLTAYPSYRRRGTGEIRNPLSFVLSDKSLYFPIRTSGCARPTGADCEYKSAENPWILSTDVKPACESADLGQADAQTYIGDIFYLGSHGNKDLVHAYVWYSLAAENAGACGSEYAANQLTKLSKQLAPGQIAEARYQLEQWQPGQFEKLLEKSNFQRK